MSIKTTSHGNKLYLIAIAVIVFNLVVLLVLLPRRNTLQESSIDSRDEIDGGAPIQRSRIDAFIDQVGTYADLSALATGLNDEVLGGEDIVFVAGGYSSDAQPQTAFLRVVADRRVARLVGMMNRLDKDVAGRFSLDLFNKKLHRYESGQNQVIDDWLDGDGKYEAVPIRENYHAVAAACFLGSSGE